MGLWIQWMIGNYVGILQGKSYYPASYRDNSLINPVAGRSGWIK